MEDKQIREFEQRAKKILNQKKLPSEIIELVEKIYVEYQEVYKKFIQSYKLLYSDTDGKQLEYIHIIDGCMEKDYQEDKKSTETVMLMEYEIKKERLENVLNIVTKKMYKDEKYGQNQEYKKDFEESDNKRENFIYTSIIRNSVLSEIGSSKAVLLQKLKTLNVPSNPEYMYAIRRAQNVFESDLNLITNQATIRLQQVEEVLNGDDKQFYAQIELIIQEYTEVKEETFEKHREEFKEKLRENIDINTVDYKNNEETKKATIRSLPDNVIE